MMVAIFIVSSIPAEKIPEFNLLDTLIKKGAHFFAYAILNFSYLLWAGKNDKRSRLVSLVLAILFAVIDEYHQTFVEGRFGSYVDVIIDGVGAVLSNWLIYKSKLFREA